MPSSKLTRSSTRSQRLEQLQDRLRPEPPFRARVKPERGGAWGEGPSPGRTYGLGNRQSDRLGLEKSYVVDLGKSQS